MIYRNDNRNMDFGNGQTESRTSFHGEKFDQITGENNIFVARFEILREPLEMFLKNSQN